MAARFQQTAFTSGEFAPDLYGRIDLAQYANGLKTLLNCFVNYHGGASNRAGTEFVVETKDSAQTSKLIPFSFNTEQTYALEFGEMYMRVIKDGGLVLESTPIVISGATAADPVVITATSHGLTNGQQVWIQDVVGMTELNSRMYLVANGTTHTFELTDTDGVDIDGTGYTAYTSGGNIYPVFELVTPYAAADLFDLDYTQSADVMTLTHPTYAERELTRTAHDAWTLTTISKVPSIAAPTGLGTSGGGSGSESYSYVVTTIKDDDGLEESLASAVETATSKSDNLTTNPLTITWSAVTGAKEYNVYKERNGIYGYIGTAGSTSFEDDGLAATLDDTPPEARDPFGSTDNYPGAVGYYQQRRIFASTNNNPQTIYTTKSGNFNNLGTSSPPKDDDAVTFTLAATQVNAIRYIVPLKDLLILTSGGEWVISGGSNDVLTPTSVLAEPQSYVGAAKVKPLVINNQALYVQDKGASIYAIGYKLESDGLEPDDITVLSTHMFFNKEVRDWAFARVPYSLVWTVMDDGSLLSLTYLPRQNVSGWGRHETDGLFESVCSISEGNEDATYFIVKRTIDGVTRRYIERLHTRSYTEVRDAFFVDCGLSYDGRMEDSGATVAVTTATDWLADTSMTATITAGTFDATYVDDVIVLRDGDDAVRFDVTAYLTPTTATVRPRADVPGSLQATSVATWERAKITLSGLDHLEGSTVASLNDGNVEPTTTVTDGEVTLQEHGAVIHVGLPYVSDIETLDLILTTQKETGRANVKSIPRSFLLMKESRGIFVGCDADNLHEHKPTRLDYATAIEPTTELVEVGISSNWNRAANLFIRQPEPLPMTLLTAIIEAELGG